MKKLAGKISIVRSSSGRESWIEIEVGDAVSGCRLVDVKMELETFAEALFGRGYCECQLEYFDQCPVGQRREVKTEVVDASGLDWRKDTNEAERVLAPFEVDGWKGTVDDLYNHHRGPVNARRVGFVRFVGVEEVGHGES